MGNSEGSDETSGSPPETDGTMEDLKRIRDVVAEEPVMTL